jgi:hypothetical protein
MLDSVLSWDLQSCENSLPWSSMINAQQKGSYYCCYSSPTSDILLKWIKIPKCNQYGAVLIIPHLVFLSVSLKGMKCAITAVRKLGASTTRQSKGFFPEGQAEKEKGGTHSSRQDSLLWPRGAKGVWPKDSFLSVLSLSHAACCVTEGPKSTSHRPLGRSQRYHSPL